MGTCGPSTSTGVLLPTHVGAASRPRPEAGGSPAAPLTGQHFLELDPQQDLSGLGGGEGRRGTDVQGREKRKSDVVSETASGALGYCPVAITKHVKLSPAVVCYMTSYFFCFNFLEKVLSPDYIVVKYSSRVRLLWC